MVRVTLPRFAAFFVHFDKLIRQPPGPLWGGVTPNQTLFLKKRFFQGPHRTILGHPKHVLHLVLSPNAIAKAFNVMQCIGLSAPLISDFGLFWANVN